MNSSTLDKLRSFSFFAGLSDAAFDALSQQCVRKTYRPHETIIGHEDDTHEVLYLLEGRARVSIYSSDGQRVSLREISQGAIFGELSAIDGQARSATVECIEPCLVAIMARRTFIDALGEHPAFRMAVMIHITQLVRKLTERVFEFSTLAVRGRVQAELLRIAKPIKAGSNEAAFSPAPTHEEIASRISTHREAVTRELAWLEERGVIVKEGRMLRITNLAELRKLAGEHASE